MFTLPTMEEAISAMVQEEMRLKLMRRANPMRSAYIVADDRECYNCGQVGHVSYNYPTPRNSGGRGSMRGGYGGFGGNRGRFSGDRSGFGGNHGGRGGDRAGHSGGRRRGQGAPQVNAAMENSKAITLIGEQVTQWEEWQKNKTSENSNTTTHFGNFANYAQVGEGTQAQALASTYRHPINWIINSGASKHVTGLHNTFTSYTLFVHSETVQIADGSSKSIHGIRRRGLGGGLGLESGVMCCGTSIMRRWD